MRAHKSLRLTFGLACILCALAALTLSARASAQAPQFSEKIVDGSPSDSVASFAKAGGKIPEIAAELSALKRSLQIVFVPGIMGSALTAADGTQIWGDSKAALSNPKQFMKNLTLPPDLVDENRDGGIDAKVLDSMFGIDFYGDAIKKIKAQADLLKIPLKTCGYDWRRDIRWGAKELQRCIEEIPGPPKNIILIAHSMGGLVAWQWAREREAGQTTGRHKSIQMVTLGSPLEGACEILRMVEVGYVQPTSARAILATDVSRAAGGRDWLVKAMSGLEGNFLNDATSKLTQAIRPLVLTWPGALELTPRSATAPTGAGCGNVPSVPNDMASPTISYYSKTFWDLPLGHSLLGSHAKPNNLEDVLAKAKEFRDQFSPKPLQVPTWTYFSLAWMTPVKMLTMVNGDKIVLGADMQGNHFELVQGDGRVRMESAFAAGERPFSYSRGVASMHGNLPADETFLNDYFKIKLPAFLDSFIAVSMATHAVNDSNWMKAYVDVGGKPLSKTDVFLAYEPALALSSPLSPGGPNTVSALATSDIFSEKIDLKATGGKFLVSYSDAIKIFGINISLPRLQTTARALGVDHQDFAFAQGNAGLKQALGGNWQAASASLLEAYQKMDNLPQGATSTSQQKIDDFKLTVVRTLAKSLYLAGQCKAAEPKLRETSDWEFSKQALSERCNDFTGLAYCFDKGGYCGTRTDSLEENEL